jgi:NAD(P)-dependent dehydrogenase (short-subunit alcohol dehydrogenase family)
MVSTPASASYAAGERPLKSKVAIVTGSTHNLGLAIADRLAGMGADIVINHHDDARREEAKQAADTLRAYDGQVLVEQADVTQPDDVKRLFDHTIEGLGRVDILINNAGLIVKNPLAETTNEDFDRCFAVNTKAKFLTMREAARRMENDGRIVNIITTIVAATIPFYSVYAGSKGAVEHFTKGLAKEVGGRGITVNCVAPGPLNTPFYYLVEDEETTAIAKRLSVANRLGEIDEVVPLVAFLCGPEARWITAQTIRVNGGMT